jgi:hypothetical protein
MKRKNFCIGKTKIKCGALYRWMDEFIIDVKSYSRKDNLLGLNKKSFAHLNKQDTFVAIEIKSLDYPNLLDLKILTSTGVIGYLHLFENCDFLVEQAT